jgi:hypothetical protein
MMPPARRRIALISKFPVEKSLDTETMIRLQKLKIPQDQIFEMFPKVRSQIWRDFLKKECKKYGYSIKRGRHK